jgi:hypothetical protein
MSASPQLLFGPLCFLPPPGTGCGPSQHGSAPGRRRPRGGRGLSKAAAAREGVPGSDELGSVSRGHDRPVAIGRELSPEPSELPPATALPTLGLRSTEVRTFPEFEDFRAGGRLEIGSIENIQRYQERLRRRPSAAQDREVARRNFSRGQRSAEYSRPAPCGTVRFQLCSAAW